MANILASRPIIDRLPSDTRARRAQAQPSTVHCLHQQRVALTRAEYDELMLLCKNREQSNEPIAAAGSHWITYPFDVGSRFTCTTLAGGKPLKYVLLAAQ